MTYLNDVPYDGETEFYHYGIKITPETGKTLMASRMDPCSSR